MRRTLVKRILSTFAAAALVSGGVASAQQPLVRGGEFIVSSQVISDTAAPATGYAGDLDASKTKLASSVLQSGAGCANGNCGGSSVSVGDISSSGGCASGNCGGGCETGNCGGGCDSGSCGSTPSCGCESCEGGCSGESGCESCGGGCESGSCGDECSDCGEKGGRLKGMLGKLGGKLGGKGSSGGDCSDGGCSDGNCSSCGGGARGYDNSDLFYNYYSQGNSNQANAQMYVSPMPVPQFVGHTFNTYQPLYPHHFLYPHMDRYHNNYDGGRGMNRTRASYSYPHVRTAVSNLYWNKLRLPR